MALWLGQRGPSREQGAPALLACPCNVWAAEGSCPCCTGCAQEGGAHCSVKHCGQVAELICIATPRMPCTAVLPPKPAPLCRGGCDPGCAWCESGGEGLGGRGPRGEAAGHARLSPPICSLCSPSGMKPDSSPKGSRGLGIKAEFLKQTGTSAPRSPRQDTAVTKGTPRRRRGGQRAWLPRAVHVSALWGWALWGDGDVWGV